MQAHCAPIVRHRWDPRLERVVERRSSGAQADMHESDRSGVGADVRVKRLRHGYTNRTRRKPDGGIEKCYGGPGRFDRARRERDCLLYLRRDLPVAHVVAFDKEVPCLVMSVVRGDHGQDLVDAGHATVVLRLVGDALRRLQRLSPSVVPMLVGQGEVIVHGDFGPQNLLIDLDLDEVTGLVDWEFAHIGGPEEDLAWAEWIVRMHHPGSISALPELHAASGLVIEWTARHAAMLTRCEELLRYCEAGGFDAGVDLWRSRLAATEDWTE